MRVIRLVYPDARRHTIGVRPRGKAVFNFYGHDALMDSKDRAIIALGRAALAACAVLCATTAAGLAAPGRPAAARAVDACIGVVTASGGARPAPMVGAPRPRASIAAGCARLIGRGRFARR